MSAETIAKALGGRRAGSCWMTRCPAHEDREPSLSIRDRGGTVLLHCHAGCNQRQVIDALRSLGLWSATAPRDRRATDPLPADHHGAGDDERQSRALRVWDASKSASGTLVEIYLASRGLTLPPPERLRFHTGLKHPTGGTWPAIVALITAGEDDRAVGVHRTFLARDGRNKAPVKPPKMMLGSCRRGAVRLGAAADILLVGEGVETCLSAMQATGRPAWAALSTSGLRSLVLPGTINHVVILADGDEPGELAAGACARRWQHDGRRVRIARPPVGMDFNDLLLAGVVAPQDAGT